MLNTRDKPKYALETSGLPRLIYHVSLEKARWREGEKRIKMCYIQEPAPHEECDHYLQTGTNNMFF